MVYCWRGPRQSTGRLSRPGSTTCRILATAADYNRKTPSLEYQPRVHTTAHARRCGDAATCISRWHTRIQRRWSRIEIPWASCQNSGRTLSFVSLSMIAWLLVSFIYYDAYTSLNYASIANEKRFRSSNSARILDPTTRFRFFGRKRPLFPEIHVLILFSNWRKKVPKKLIRPIKIIYL